MPRPRFNRLSAEKRDRILRAAAQEFAIRGFEEASFSGILEKAGVSKGAGYYYFDDKADLFSAVVGYYGPYLSMVTDIQPDQLNAETFWPTVIDLYRDQYLRTHESPWMLGSVRVVSRLSEESRAHEQLATLFNAIWAWLQALVRRGQDLGVIRTDLPDDLLLAMIVGIDEAADEWMLQHLHEMERTQVLDMATRIANTLRGALAPLQ